MSFAGTLFVVIYLGAVFLATAFILTAFLRGVRKKGAALPFKPVPAIFTPIPVESTPGVWVLGMFALAWSVGHVGTIGWWLATGNLVTRSAPAVGAGLYLSFATFLVGVGGVLLLAHRPFGRRLIAWGMILLALLAFYALIISMLLPKFEDVPMAVRRSARLIGLFVAVHLLFDVAIGALAQKVGRPEGWSQEQEDQAIPEVTADQAMPSVGDFDQNS